VINADVISRIPAIVPPIRIGFSRLVPRTLAIDAVALIANLDFSIRIGGGSGKSASMQ
jgi:hypothetical protein